jgi:hypothetical protein
MGTPHVGGDVYSRTDLTIFFVGAVWARRARRTSSIVGDAGAFPLEDELGGGVVGRVAADLLGAGLVRGTSSIFAF